MGALSEEKVSSPVPSKSKIAEPLLASMVTVSSEDEESKVSAAVEQPRLTSPSGKDGKAHQSAFHHP